MVRVHLISTPWASPLHPSIQTGILKSYLCSTRAAAVSARCYSPSFTIPYYVDGANYWNLFQRLAPFEEYSYLLLYARRYLNLKLNRQVLEPFRIGSRQLDRLDWATEKYVRDRIVPNLSDAGTNVLAFTCVFNQVFASVYLAAMCRALAGPSVQILSVFGGALPFLPQCLRVLRRLAVEGLIVIGEGEEKLAAIVDAIGSGDVSPRPDTLHAIVPGVYSIKLMQPTWERDERSLRSGVGKLESLPLPDYSDFFDEVREACADESAFNVLRDRVQLPLEGSRGCFCHCDFCGLNYLWSGFRSMSGESVLRRAQELAVRYQTHKFLFVDNVCDSWALSFATEARKANLHYEAFFELRAAHPEKFWTVLAESGAVSLQIGVEALAPSLLQAMKKGTYVYQNIAAWKYLRELGVEHGYANLITHHPLSTIEDVRFARRLIEQSSHLATFFLSEYTLQFGSPLYDALTLSERRSLKGRAPRLGLSRNRNPVKRRQQEASVLLPRALRWLFFSPFYISPRRYRLSSELEQAWDDFWLWYTRASKGREASPRRLERIFLATGVAKVVDTRKGTHTEYVLEGAELAVLEAGHAAPLVSSLVDRVLNYTANEISAALRKLESRALIVVVDDHVISLPLRPKDELLANLTVRGACS